MKQNTNNPEITITRDGLVTHEFEPTIVERVGSTAGIIAVHALWAAGRALGRVVGECATSLELEFVDAKNGSNLRSEWFARKRELAETAMRERVGL